MTTAVATADDDACVLPQRDVLYCGACGMPPEYCEYGPDYESHCLPWLTKQHPALCRKLHPEVQAARPTEPWTTQERLVAFYEKYEPEKIDSVPTLLEKYEGKYDKLFMALVKKYGPEPEDPFYMDQEEEDTLEHNLKDLAVSNKRRGASAKKSSKVDTRIVIQKISRNRKKAVTIVVGMDTIPGIQLKSVSKEFSKRFAGSSSVKDGAKGKEIIIQGNHMEDVAAMVVEKFGVPADSVFLDMDGSLVPYDE